MTSAATPGLAQRPSKLVTDSSSRAQPRTGLGEVAARPRQALRRPTKQASYELCNHAKAYLEGGQVASGYDFLYSLLAANTSISTPAQPYIGFLAPPAYVAFAASLVVYPKYTTQTHSREIKKGPDAALRYLQCIHATIDGPAYPAIRAAFSFAEERSRRRAPGRRSAAASPSPGPGSDIDRIAGGAANAESLWARAEDFWHIVGWAFNCSLAHKKRWRRWKLWLTVILDLLESDWDFCVRASEIDEANEEVLLRESLLWKFIVGTTDTANRGARRRIVKAILATATTESVRDYPEVWNNETSRPKIWKVGEKSLGEVNFENGNPGDYDSDEEMQDETNDTSDGEHPPSNGVNGVRSINDAVNQLGGSDAIELRQRLFALLAQVAVALPHHFTILSDFFDNILEDFIQLPTIVFEVLLSTSKMPPLLRLAFNTNLLLPLVNVKIHDYLRSEPVQEHLESTLLKLKGTTQSFAANAKISLILEQVLIYMMSHSAIVAGDSLRKALESGIEARHGVYGTGRGKKGNSEEEDRSRTVMHGCSDRMLGLLEVLEFAAGKPSLPLKAKEQGVPAFLSFTSGSSLSPAPDSDTEIED